MTGTHTHTHPKQLPIKKTTNASNCSGKSTVHEVLKMILLLNFPTVSHGSGMVWTTLWFYLLPGGSLNISIGRDTHSALSHPGLFLVLKAA